MTTESAPNTLRLKVTLVGSKPLIWRDLLVPAEVRLDRLHRMLQAAMGWKDLHLHEFTVGEDTYGPDDEDAEDDLFLEEEYTLEEISQEIDLLDYEYDFGDSWQHRIEVTERTVVEPPPKFAVVLAGENACPVEDSGGVIRHTMLVESLSTPNHELHGEMQKQFGSYDLTGFDLAGTNARLKRI